jgi:hypothetical protein
VEILEYLAGRNPGISHSNQISNRLGIAIISINIISANPVDDQFTASLTTGVVASVEALDAEAAARGGAKATKIEAEAAAIIS